MSSNTSAAEKEKSVLVIHEVVANDLCEAVNRSELLNDLFKLFHAKKPPGTCEYLFIFFILICYISKEIRSCLLNS